MSLCVPLSRQGGRERGAVCIHAYTDEGRSVFCTQTKAEGCLEVTFASDMYQITKRYTTEIVCRQAKTGTDIPPRACHVLAIL